MKRWIQRLAIAGGTLLILDLVGGEPRYLWQDALSMFGRMLLNCCAASSMLGERSIPKT